MHTLNTAGEKSQLDLADYLTKAKPVPLSKSPSEVVKIVQAIYQEVKRDNNVQDKAEYKDLMAMLDSYTKAKIETE